MKYSVLLFWAGMTVGHAFAQPSYTVSENNVSLLKRYRQDYCKSWKDNSPHLLSGYYADTIRLMPAFQRTILGKNNAMAYFMAFQKRFTVEEVTRSEIEIQDLGGQVLETGTFTMRLRQRAPGKDQVLEGKYVNLWLKTSVENLSLITDAWNYDHYYGDIHDQLKFDDIPSVHAALLPNVLVNNTIRFELAALNRLLDATVTQHDDRTWSLYYAGDAMLMASYFPAFKGKRAIDDYLKQHVKELPVFEALDIRNDRIDNLGTYVIEYASHIASWRNGDSSGVSMGKNIRIWRRESDHSLKIFRSIGMYD